MVRTAATDWTSSQAGLVLPHGLMLRVTVQFIVAMLAYALNERVARKADYLRE